MIVNRRNLSCLSYVCSHYHNVKCVKKIVVEISRDTETSSAIEVLALLKSCATKHPRRAKTSAAPRRKPQISQGKEFSEVLAFQRMSLVNLVIFLFTFWLTKLKIAARRSDILTGIVRGLLSPSRKVLEMYLLLDSATSFRNSFTYHTKTCHNTV
jgi:hypothetical protein